ncbi:Emc2p [Sporobolomyces salmoneus]|uniref:Emc2p n=1 Tax=Sporobolomyces salmoneus TaxID=183962 RepID=UPI003172B743
MSLSTSSILTRLEEIRTSRSRVPREVFELGQKLVENGWINNQSNQGWIVKEQLAVAALECGQLELASVLIDRLDAQFPSKESQRILSLKGMLFEAKGDLESARQLYEQRLKEKETDVLIRKRLISLHLSTPLNVTTTTSLSRQEGIRLLVEYCDTSYVDAEAWMLLSKSYSELGLYDQSLSASNHSLLLQPQNPFLLLQHAELSYTIDPLSEVGLKEFLRVVEMTTDLSVGKEGRGLEGCGRRAAFGAKNCISRLKSAPLNPKTTTTSTFTKLKLDELEVMVTRLILGSYEKQAGATKGEELRVVREWLKI